MEKVVTMRASEHAGLLEALSERLLSDFTQELWRKVFLGPGYECIRFERETLTFLCTDTLDFDWTPEELETLAAHHHGRIERCDHRVVLAFPQARNALQMALVLQRSASCRLRMTLLTARCNMAIFEQDGKPRRLAIDTEVRQACDWADQLPAGSIHVSAETCSSLGPSREWQSLAARLAAGREGAEATPAAVTLALTPRAVGANSFAGAGLA